MYFAYFQKKIASFDICLLLREMGLVCNAQPQNREEFIEKDFPCQYCLINRDYENSLLIG